MVYKEFKFKHLSEMKLEELKMPLKLDARARMLLLIHPPTHKH